ncbi:hypothetical protein ACQPX6_27675 [Actinomycetospora sp. CA-101289]|uniref:hypothetical protein n=1 Tax=Actinomycetospora sp. CA-101289 TaxID=3239893 RepID=UPI003D9850F1
MLRNDADELDARRDARRAEAERLEELAFETEVQASLTRPEHPAVPPLLDGRLRSLLGPGASPSRQPGRDAGTVA